MAQIDWSVLGLCFLGKTLAPTPISGPQTSKLHQFYPFVKLTNDRYDRYDRYDISIYLSIYLSIYIYI